MTRIHRPDIASEPTVTENFWGIMKRYFLVFVLSFFLIFSTASAQTQNGAIEGTVRDFNGKAIAGVNVTASSPSLIQNSTDTTTDPNGFYRFQALPAGVYEVTAQLSGFEIAVQKDVRVFITKTLEVSFTLQLSKVTETLEIIEAPPLIDVSTPAVSTIVPREIISSAPEFAQLQQLLTFTPGISDDLIAYGASEPSSSVWIDGVNLTDPRTATLNTVYDQNWIDELQVIGIGAPAEYGGFTGVIGNFTIKSGGNQFHGLVETFFQNEKLTDQNVSDPPPERPFDSYEVSAQLGGPLVSEKLWFFTGFQYLHRETQPFNYPGTTSNESKNIISKLTFKWDQNNTLQGFAHFNDHHLADVGASAFVPPEATSELNDPQSSWNVSWTSVFTPETTLEARYGGQYKELKSVEDRPDLPGHVDLGTGTASVNDLFREREKRTRHQATVNLSHYARNFIAGSHDFRFGMEIERSDAITSNYYNGGLWYYDYYGEPYMRYVTDGYLVAGSNNRTSGYAQDDWRLTDDLTLSLGVRWDHNRAFTDRGLVIKNDPVAPRIGMVWLLDSNTQTVIKAHYGDYYEALVERLYVNLTDGVDTNIVELYIDGTWVEVARLHRVIFGDPDLKHPYVRQFTIGVDRVLHGDIPFGVHYIYRRFGNIIEDVGLSEYEPVPFVNPLTGETISVFRLVGDEVKLLLTNPEDLYRNYHGLQITGAKYISKDFYVSGSIVFSTTNGNAPPFVVGNPPREGPTTATPFLNDPNTAINFPGDLSSDRGTIWKIVGMYQLPFGFNTGWYLRHSGGGAWAATVRVPFAVVNQDVRILAEPAGSRKLPSQTLMDLRFEKQFSISNGHLRFTLDVFNLFNSAYGVSVVDRFESPDFGKSLAFTEPRRMRLGVRYTF